MRAFVHQEKILQTKSPRNKQGRSRSRQICGLTFFHFPSKPQLSTLSTSTLHLYILLVHYWPHKKGDFLNLTELYRANFLTFFSVGVHQWANGWWLTDQSEIRARALILLCYSGAPWVRKCGKLPIQEKLVITWPYTARETVRPHHRHTNVK